MRKPKMQELKNIFKIPKQASGNLPIRQAGKICCEGLKQSIRVYIPFEVALCIPKGFLKYRELIPVPERLYI